MGLNAELKILNLNCTVGIIAARRFADIFYFLPKKNLFSYLIEVLIRLYCICMLIVKAKKKFCFDNANFFKIRSIYMEVIISLEKMAAKLRCILLHSGSRRIQFVITLMNLRYRIKLESRKKHFNAIKFIIIRLVCQS